MSDTYEPTKARKRLQLDLGPMQSEALDELKALTMRTSYGEVVRDALELYDLVLSKVSAGKHVYIGDSREESGEVILPQIERARRGR